MNQRRSPSWPALTSDQERGWMRAVYIERFLEDPATEIPLRKLRERYLARLAAGQTGATLVAATLPECEQVAATLLRLPAIADDIFSWLHWGRNKPADTALAAARSVIAAFSTPSPTGMGGYGPVIADTRLTVEDEWNPAREPRAAASRRLIRRIEDEMDRLEKLADAVGYHVLDTRPNGTRDIGWLVAHVRDGQTYRAIADRHDGQLGEDAVGRAVRRTAGLIGIVDPEV